MGKGKAARFGLLAAAVVTAFPALAADDADTHRQLQRLMERVEQLEKHNAELEQALQPPATGANSQIEARLKALEERNTRLDSALSTEDMSEKEPELAARLKAVEYQALDIQKQAKVIDSIEGFSAGANFTTVAQRASGIDNSGTQLNYRADITEVLLLLLGGALLVDGAEKLVGLETLPPLADPLWNTMSLLDDSTRTGGLVAAFTGYRAAPSGMAYALLAVYWALALGVLLKLKPMRRKA